MVLGACAPDDDDNDLSPDTPAVTSAAETPGPGSSGPAPSRYVALGDSFAALGPTSAPTTGPAGCLRSTRNYPALVAQRAGAEEFVDATCGGARTADMTSRQIAQTPPQLDALTAGTDLVTLSIGGNDIGFGDIASCVFQTPRADTGAPCRDRLESATTAALSELPDRLDRVYAGIRDRSPDARIITTAYMPLVPDDGGCDFVSRMSPGDVTWTRHVTERINRIVTEAADRADADVAVPTDAAARHACAPPDVRYTDFTGVETGSHPMHPTAVGQSAMADAVVDLL